MTNVKKANEAAKAIELYHARASGRTFRMVLSAVLACSQMQKGRPRTVYLIGNDCQECRRMHYIASSILQTISGTDTVVDEICLPNGSRLLFRPYNWYKHHRDFVRSQERNGDKSFIDHYALEYKG